MDNGLCVRHQCLDVCCLFTRSNFALCSCQLISSILDHFDNYRPTATSLGDLFSDVTALAWVVVLVYKKET